MREFVLAMVWSTFFRGAERLVDAFTDWFDFTLLRKDFPKPSLSQNKLGISPPGHSDSETFILPKPVFYSSEENI